MTASRLTLWLLFAPFLAWVLLLVVIPHIDLLILSLREKVAPRVYETGFRNYADFITSSVYPWTLFRTVAFSLVTTAVTFVIGFPVAFYIAKVARGRRRAALFLLCLLPFWVSEIVRVFGWMMILRETGLLSGFLQWAHVTSGPVEFLYNDAAIMIGLVYTSMLFMIVPLISTIDGLDDALIEAGYDLGGNGVTVMTRIVIPYAMPGIMAGSIVVFMLSLGNYLTPTLLGGKNGQWFTAQIYNQFITRFNWELGSAFGFILLITSTLVVWLLLRLSGQSLSNTLGR
ncbi:ABC transporter permease [Frigidibacter sp. ROC022]|uniref:ABC transporter permease n=1 Tax=Frigidibacter sp. ROC022 TaxID=2971796 RepID=UPI00215B3CA9|nr:ABC transporter permease [Frigidibacter sp. ROC022]MCR8723308.1 ABC transporter permease [Frigidibacter sp. ROC022]